MSLRSTSLKVTVPVAISASVGFTVVGASSVTVPDCTPLVIVRPSLVPWIVMVTAWALLAPVSSVTVTVKTSVRVSSAPRNCAAALVSV